MQALLEIDDGLLGWLSLLYLFRFRVLSDGLLRLSNVFRLAQISNDALSRVEIDSCFLFDAISGIHVLWELVSRNFREYIFDLDVFSNGLIDPLNGILDINEISNNNIWVLEGLDLIWDINPLILNRISPGLPPLVLSSTAPTATSAVIIITSSATASSSVSLISLIEIDPCCLHEKNIVLIFKLLPEVFFQASIEQARYIMVFVLIDFNDDVLYFLLQQLFDFISHLRVVALGRLYCHL